MNEKPHAHSELVIEALRPLIVTIEALRPLIEPETPWNTCRDVVTIEIPVEVWNNLNQLWGALHADLRLGRLEADHCHPSTNEENGDEEARREVLADARRELGGAY